LKSRKGTILLYTTQGKKYKYFEEKKKKAKKSLRGVYSEGAGDYGNEVVFSVVKKTSGGLFTC